MPCIKFKSEWIRHLLIKPDTVKVIEKKVGKSLKYMVTWEIFLNRTPIDDVVRSRIGKWDLINLSSFWLAKHNVNRTKKELND